jgi:hypothetical protein
MNRRCHDRPAAELTVDAVTIETVRAPWTCQSGEMALPTDMPTQFVWQSRWWCRRNADVENLGPEDCRRCRRWEFTPRI